MANVFISGDIGSDYAVSLNTVREQVPEDAKEITVYINSNGGEIDEGFAIYNYLKSFDGNVTTIVEGYAYSIASVIFMAGNNRLMHPQSKIMIHNPWGGVGGDAEQISRYADMLQKEERRLADFYVASTGNDLEQIKSFMKKETYLDATESIKLGFATEITQEQQKIAASVDKKPIAIINKNRLIQMEKDKQQDPVTMGKIEKMFNDFFSKFSKGKRPSNPKNLFTVTAADGTTEMYVEGDANALLNNIAYKVEEGLVQEEVVSAGTYQLQGGATITVNEEGAITEVSENEEPKVIDEEKKEMRKKMKQMEEELEALRSQSTKHEEEKNEAIAAQTKMIKEVKALKNRVLGEDLRPKAAKDPKPQAETTADSLAGGFMALLSDSQREKLNKKITQN